MAKKKFYAVKEGMTRGIFTTWTECQQAVLGYPRAIYKSFTKIEDAEAFINSEKKGYANY